MSALLNHLKNECFIDTKTLMAEIEDIVIKTIMSATAQMLPAINCFVPHNQNCFGNLIYVNHIIDLFDLVCVRLSSATRNIFCSIL